MAGDGGFAMAAAQQQPFGTAMPQSVGMGGGFGGQNPFGGGFNQGN